jgi:hypothetical protein
VGYPSIATDDHFVTSPASAAHSLLLALAIDSSGGSKETKQAAKEPRQKDEKQTWHWKVHDKPVACYCITEGCATVLHPVTCVQVWSIAT